MCKCKLPFDSCLISHLEFGHARNRQTCAIYPVKLGNLPSHLNVTYNLKPFS